MFVSLLRYSETLIWLQIALYTSAFLCYIFMMGKRTYSDTQFGCSRVPYTLVIGRPRQSLPPAFIAQTLQAGALYRWCMTVNVCLVHACLVNQHSTVREAALVCRVFDLCLGIMRHTGNCMRLGKKNYNYKYKFELPNTLV